MFFNVEAYFSRFFFYISPSKRGFRSPGGVDGDLGSGVTAKMWAREIASDVSRCLPLTLRGEDVDSIKNQVFIVVYLMYI